MDGLPPDHKRSAEQHFYAADYFEKAAKKHQWAARHLMAGDLLQGTHSARSALQLGQRAADHAALANSFFPAEPATELLPPQAEVGGQKQVL